MKPIHFSTALLTLLLSTAAMAQPEGAHVEGDSYSYHRTVTFTGPDVHRSAGERATTGQEVTHEIPTIDEVTKGHAREDVAFVTGGVGDDERAAMEAAKSDYNLRITSARADGAFVGDTEIIIREKTGKQEEMLDVEAGPLLYAQLPPGSYVLEAAVDSETKRQEFTIGKKQRKPVTLRLIWKAAAE